MGIQPEERRACHDSALRCFGTAYIFECRAAPLRVALKLLAFSSLAGPVSIGALVVSVGASSRLLPLGIGIASFLSFAQILLSLWALVSHWQENLSYCLESKADNYRLAEKFVALGNNTRHSDGQWCTEYAVLEALGGDRQQLDLHHDITNEEKQMGMCAGLRQYQRECASCKKVPKALATSACPTCGQFKRRTWKWLL